jgi:hypothetical protein
MLRFAQHDSQDSSQGSPSPLTGEVFSPNVYVTTGLIDLGNYYRLKYVTGYYWANLKVF